jgi:hypothetical protein
LSVKVRGHTFLNKWNSFCVKECPLLKSNRKHTGRGDAMDFQVPAVLQMKFAGGIW